MRPRALAVSIALHIAVLAYFLIPARKPKYPESQHFYGAYVVFRPFPKPAGSSGPAAPAPLKTTRKRFLRQPHQMPAPPVQPQSEPASEPEPQVELLESAYPLEVGNTVSGPAGAGMSPSGTGDAPGGGGPPGAGPRNFDEETMLAPHRVSGRDPEYTRAALEHEVEGTMLVACHVAVDGKVTACHVLRSLPFMDKEAITALEGCTYSPARLADGTPIDVEYVFRIVMRLTGA
jgi:periplasmic protein TonB